MSKVTSFAVEIRGSSGTVNGRTTKVTGETVVVLPNLQYSVMSTDDGTSETLFNGSVVYRRDSGNAWSAYRSSGPSLDPATNLLLRRNPGVKLLPDRLEAGVAVGSFLFPSTPTPPGPFLASSIRCTYDKTTFLLKACSMTMPDMGMLLVLTYTKWNDPANVVTIPHDLPSTPPGPPPTPAPFVVPSPNRGASQP